MKVLDRLPYHDKPTILSFGSRTVEVRAHQIVVWVSIRRLVFPAVLDTGHSHNFTIAARHLKEWAGVDALEQIGEVEVNRRRMPQYHAQLRLHRNRPGTRQPTPDSFPLVVDEGITVIPGDDSSAPRLPLLGLRSISRSRLKLIVDGNKREVTLKTSGWF